MLDLLTERLARLFGVAVELGPWQVLGWWIVLTVGFGAVWVVLGQQEKYLWTDRRLAWWLWHWFTGGELDTGRNPEHQGTLAGHLRRRALIGAGRTAVAVGFVLAVYLGGGAMHGTSPGTLAAWGIGGVATLAAITLAVTWYAVRIALDRWWVQPLAASLAKLAGHPPDLPARRWIRVPRLWERHRLGVRIWFAPGFDMKEANLREIERVVTKRAGLHDAEPEWDLEGRGSTVTFRPAVHLPALVPFSDDDVRAMFEDPTRAHTPLFGLGRDGPVAYSIESDSPHVVLSAPTKGGKSSILRAVAAQLLYHGALVFVIDIKRHSHLWARDLNRVTYTPDYDAAAGDDTEAEQEINARLVELGAEADRRNRACDSLRAGDPMPDFERLVILCDEINATTEALNRWWSGQRSRNDSKEAPGVIALRKILFMGRAVRVHVVGAAQRASARALGGGDARENFAIVILAGGYSVQTWRMVADHCEWIAPTEHDGWGVVIYGPSATPLQMPWIDEVQAHDWCASRVGEVRKPPPDGRRVHVSPGGNGHAPRPGGDDTGGVQPSDQGGDVDRDTAASDGPLRLVSLREAVDQGLVECTLVDLRNDKARHRETFPKVWRRRESDGAALYWDEQLMRWDRERGSRRKSRARPVVYHLVHGGPDAVLAARPGSQLQVKIGRTDSLMARLGQLTMRPEDVVHLIVCDTTAESKAREARMHDRYEDYRVHKHDPTSEWFYVRGDLAAYLRPLAEAEMARRRQGAAAR
jgi:hypothetical protein